MLKRETFHANTLNEDFTENDFSFINNADNELKELKTQEEIHQSRKNAIEILKTFLLSTLDNEYNSQLDELLCKANSTLDLINENIDIFTKLKDSIEDINKSISELLASVRANNPENSYTVQIIKNTISEYSEQLQTLKPKTFLNNIKIDNFLNEPTTKEYLSKYAITIETNSQTVAENTSDKENYSNKEDTTIEITSNTEEREEKIKNNNKLIISEKSDKVFLPYTAIEIKEYLEQYPKEYTSEKDVIEKEFILPLNYFIRQPIIARFREAYSLIRDKEAKSIIEALKFAIDLMFKFELNPVIIAACKSQEQLQSYLDCLNQNSLSNFKDFEIKFEINPTNILV